MILYMDFFHDCSVSFPVWIALKNSRKVCSTTNRKFEGTWNNRLVMTGKFQFDNAQGRIGSHLWPPYLYVVIPVIMEIQDPIYLRISTNVNVFSILDAFTDGLPRVFLHLNVVKFPAIQFAFVSDDGKIVATDVPGLSYQRR